MASTRPSLTVDLAQRLAASSIPEASAPKAITITSQFAKGFVLNQTQGMTDFTSTPSIFTSGLDTTPYSTDFAGLSPQ